MRRWVEITLRRQRLNGTTEESVHIIETANIVPLCGAINALCADGWTAVRTQVRTQCDNCSAHCDGTYAETYSDCPLWEAVA